MKGTEFIGEGGLKDNKINFWGPMKTVKFSARRCLCFAAFSPKLAQQKLPVCQERQLAALREAAPMCLRSSNWPSQPGEAVWQPERFLQRHHLWLFFLSSSAVLFFTPCWLLFFFFASCALFSLLPSPSFLFSKFLTGCSLQLARHIA